MSSTDPSFPSGFDARFAFGPGGRWTGYFGRDVLRGLVEGIDEFHATKARERPGIRILGPALLGAFMSLGDRELVQRIAAFPYACVMITKKPRDSRSRFQLARLQGQLERCDGFPASALPELDSLVRCEDDGKAPVVGPYSTEPDIMLSALRAIGYRKTDDEYVPILHTKMVLLGEVWWHDEDALGHVADVIGFEPQRLWVASANGTRSSRKSLEFGFWLDDPELLRQAKRFLTELLSYSEEFDPDADVPEPSLVEPEYDDEAFAEAMPDWDEYEDESE
jgi:hypothetical protein